MRKQDLKLTISGVLSKLPLVQSQPQAFVGLDGFIDKIQRPVKAQLASGSTFYSSLDSFGQRIKEASDQSAQIELQTKTIKLAAMRPFLQTPWVTWELKVPAWERSVCPRYILSFRKFTPL